ncbi:MAG: matrixin family metalloprotease [Myxococcota bacterium]
MGVLAAAPAHAYELKEPQEGVFVRWHQNDVVLRLADDTGAVDRELLTHSLAIAADAWRHQSAAPQVFIREGGPSEPDPLDGINSVHVLDEWPTWRFGATLAVTISTYEPTGHLIDTDILIDGRTPLEVVASADSPRFDLPSVLTHEVGHVLGLDESGVEGATMWPTLRRGDITQRTLSEDDVDGVIALYGDGAAGTTVEEFSCSTAPSAAHAWLVVMLLSLRGSRLDPKP